MTCCRRRWCPINLRDKALLALLSLQVLRTVEITPANVDDVQQRDDHWAQLVRGKGHDRLIYLREDVAQTVHAYLECCSPCRPMRSAFL